MRSRFLLAVCLLALSSLAPVRAEDAVARGRYLATVGDCVVCHTAPVAGARPFAGGYPLHAVFGTVYSTNITPDETTGIGNWTADQFYRALHDGIASDGRHLYPAFPYPYFTRTPRADSDAIFAYLRSLKPVRSTPPPNELIFPTNIRVMMTFWNWLFLDKTPLKHRQNSQRWNRGSDIVNGFGHCGACHTPKNALFSDQSGKAFQGAVIDNWFAPDLTGSLRGGLGRWTQADITAYLKTGHNRFGRVTGSMKDVVKMSTSRMTDDDRMAIADYLKSLPPAPERAPKQPDERSMRDGQVVFVQRCAICHKDGAPGDYPKLAGNSIVEASNPTTVLRVILQGSQSVRTPYGQSGFSMPAFAVLSDSELADVVTYIRNSWGNRAEPVFAAEAKHVRDAVAPDETARLSPTRD